MVKLNKVYRNPKQVLEFLQNIGYKILQEDIQNTHDGICEVINVQNNSIQDQIEFITKNTQNQTSKHIGVLCFEDEQAKQLQIIFKEQQNIHPMTIEEAQGIEFDIVYVIGFSEEILTIPQIEKENIDYQKQYKDMITDYVYVACTRAKEELYITISDKSFNLLNKLE